MGLASRRRAAPLRFHAGQTTKRSSGSGGLQSQDPQRPAECGALRRISRSLHIGGMRGWGGRIRTSGWRNQNPLPYHLATPQCVARLKGLGGKRADNSSGSPAPQWPSRTKFAPAEGSPHTPNALNREQCLWTRDAAVPSLKGQTSPRHCGGSDDSQSTWLA